MRLIDADNISFYCNYEGDCTGGIDDCKKCENYICNFRYIQNQPTAYDIDKVVEELEDLEIHFDNDYFTSNGEAMIVKNDAIEIVKQDGVSDDVCEWEYDYKFVSDKYKRETGCGHTFYDLHHAVPFNKHCPYCGKKIKIVGD